VTLSVTKPLLPTQVPLYCVRGMSSTLIRLIGNYKFRTAQEKITSTDVSLLIDCLIHKYFSVPQQTQVLIMRFDFD
jgi:hypothetical protein